MAAICGSSSLFQLVGMAGDIPEYLVRMVRRPVPAEAVILGTTPVIAFGDPRRAEIATLGINPSFREFHSGDGSLLAGPTRRLPTLESLGAESTRALTADQIQSPSRSAPLTFPITRINTGSIRWIKYCGTALGPVITMPAPAISTSCSGRLHLHGGSWPQG